MDKLEKAIEEAAIESVKGHSETQSKEIIFHCMRVAKSQAAKEYWLQKLSEEFESKSDDSYIEVIEM